MEKVAAVVTKTKEKWVQATRRLNDTSEERVTARLRFVGGGNTPIITSSSRSQQKSLEEFHPIERGASQDNSRVAESVKVHSSSRRKMGVVQWE